MLMITGEYDILLWKSFSILNTVQWSEWLFWDQPRGTFGTVVMSHPEGNTQLWQEKLIQGRVLTLKDDTCQNSRDLPKPWKLHNEQPSHLQLLPAGFDEDRLIRGK